MAKTPPNQIKAVKKYQAKRRRFTMLFGIEEYNRLCNLIAPATMADYIRSLIKDDLIKRNRIEQARRAEQWKI